MKKKIGIIVFMVGALAISGCGTEAPSAIGVVDHQTVVMSHPDMAAAQKTMEDEYSKIQNQIMDSSTLPDEERRKRVEVFRKRLAALEKEQLVPIQKAADEAINEVMKEQGLSAVFDKRSIVAGGKDITKNVLIKEGLSSEDADKVISDSVAGNETGNRKE